jgi:hypothetical protein
VGKYGKARGRIGHFFSKAGHTIDIGEIAFCTLEVIGYYMITEHRDIGFTLELIKLFLIGLLLQNIGIFVV